MAQLRWTFTNSIHLRQLRFTTINVMISWMGPLFCHYSLLTSSMTFPLVLLDRGNVVHHEHRTAHARNRQTWDGPKGSPRTISNDVTHSHETWTSANDKFNCRKSVYILSFVHFNLDLIRQRIARQHCASVGFAVFNSELNIVVPIQKLGLYAKRLSRNVFQ